MINGFQNLQVSFPLFVLLKNYYVKFVFPERLRVTIRLYVVLLHWFNAGYNVKLVCTAWEGTGPIVLQPTLAGVQPIVASVQPIVASVQPTVASVQPTIASLQPTVVLVRD